MASAKIIKEISDEIKRCECTKELAKQLENKEKQVVPTTTSPHEPSSSGLTKYSLPNY